MTDKLEEIDRKTHRCAKPLKGRADWREIDEEDYQWLIAEVRRLRHEAQLREASDK